MTGQQVSVRRARRTDGRNHERVCNEKLPLPVQYQAAVKVTSGFYCGDSGQDGLVSGAQQDSLTIPVVAVASIEPFLVLYRRIHGTVERFSPVQMGGVEVRMRDDYRFQPAFGFDLVTLVTTSRPSTNPWCSQLTNSTVSSSRSVMQSHKTLPCAV